MNIFKKLFRKKKPEPPSPPLFIPYHIQTIANLYPILNAPGNRAEGEIEKFHLLREDIFKIGERMNLLEFTDTHRTLDCIWVHLGRNYFKLIMKA